MKVKIDEHYTRAELDEIIAGLISYNVIKPSEVYAEEELQKLELSFFDLHELLYPAYDRLVKYNRANRKGWFDQSETTDFYVWFTLQMLRGCQLQEYVPSCAFEVGNSKEEELFVLRAGSINYLIIHRRLNHSEFISHIVSGINMMLKQGGFNTAFYETALDEGSAFLLLSPPHHQVLLEERLIRFSGAEYPEIEAWRATLREEDRLF